MKKPTPASVAVNACELTDFELDDDDFIVGGFVILLTKDGHGRTGIYVKHSESLDWITRQGMLTYIASVEVGDNWSRE